MNQFDIIIIGGGAAGMFASAVLDEEAPELNVLVLEKGSVPLAKVRVSGGGRCNLTHACTDIREFVQNYPRGGRELIGAFHRFGPAETMAWFDSRGVSLVTFADGTVFPKSDTSEDVIRTLAKKEGKIKTHSEVRSIAKEGDQFCIELITGEKFICGKVLVATGGGAFVHGLGHTVEPCVPSLFTFNTSDRGFTQLAGITIEQVHITVGKLQTEGSLLITHNGVSGPAVLRLSSFGARILAENGYCFEMRINWLPDQREDQVLQFLEGQRTASPHKQLGTWSPVGLPSRLWKSILIRAEVDAKGEWGGCSSKALRQLAAQLCGFVLPIIGKNRHREEFVTCGGVRLSEVDFRTMESRLVPGLYFAGEVLDIDGLTGGFNLQAAWTTGYLAAQAMM